MSPTTVRVDPKIRGGWEVALSDQGDRVRCEPVEEASRVAYRCAAERQPCELIVCDAYHRVRHHELIKVSDHRARRLPSKSGSLVSL